MEKLTQEQFDQLAEGTEVVVRYGGSPRDVQCVVAIDEHGRRGVNPAVFGRTDWSPLTNWLRDLSALSGPGFTHVSLKE